MATKTMMRNWNDREGNTMDKEKTDFKYVEINSDEECTNYFNASDSSDEATNAFDKLII